MLPTSRKSPHERLRKRRRSHRERTAARSRGLPNTWLELAGGLGHFGTFLLMASYFLLLLAPLFWMVNLHSLIPSHGRTTLEELILILSGPELLVHVANLLAIPGVIFISTALSVTVVGLWRQRVSVRPEVLAIGAMSGGVLLTWVPLRLYATAQDTGNFLTLDAVAATGGFTLASLTLLLSTLLWMGFTLGVSVDTSVRRLTCFHWPVFAAVNVLGASAIAAFFQSLAAGAPSQDVFLLGAILKVTLVPVLAVVAYAILRDKFRLLSTVPQLMRETHSTGWGDGRLPSPPSRRDPSRPKPTASDGPLGMQSLVITRPKE